MARFLRLVLIALRRDAAAGELRLLAAALIIAVAAMASVAFFVDRVRNTLAQESHQLLAADLVIESNHPIRTEHLEAAERAGLRSARMANLASVASAGERLQLSDLKAVETAYPLRGNLEIAPAPFATPVARDSAPAPGTVWVEARVLQALGLAVGDAIGVGAIELRIDGVIVLEPDRGSQLFSLAPRVLMNFDDLPATQLVLPGSRIRYALLVAGEPEPLQRFRASLSLQRGEELESIDDARPEVNRALERAEQFLSLAGLTSVIVAGIAIALSARRFSQRHMDTCAIMRTFGATQRQIIALFGLEILVLGLVSSVAGGILGYGAHLVIVNLLGGAVGGTLAPPSLAPFHVAWLTGVITISGFALPPLVGLWTVPPLRVLRRDVTPRIRGHYLLYVAALGAVALLAPWGSGSRAVTLYTLGGSAAACATLALAAYLLVILLRRVRHGVGAAWRYGMASIARHAGGSVLQTTAIGLGVMILLLLAVVRNDLLDEWRGTLAPDAPNHFLINVQPGDVEPLRAFLGSRGVTVPDIYPMVRGRLVRINDRDVSPDDYFNPEARRLVDREFNLSMTEQPAADNRIVEGRWWTDAGAAPDQLSMEQGIAMQLGLKLGDRLSFQIADSTISASITSIRTVDWDSFNVNFFVIGAPGLFDRQPATYITSFFLSQADREWLPDLVNRFPSVTLIDVDAIMRQVRAIMDRVTMAIEFVFGFTVIAGLMVLWAAIQSTQDERRYDAAIFKSVGASHTTLRAAAIAELATLGLLAGGIAAAAAAIAGGVFASQVFEIRYVPDVALLLAGVIACALFVVTGGYLALRHALRQPPITLLRQGI